MAGYSGTPLVKKLGLIPGRARASGAELQVVLLDEPEGFRDQLVGLPETTRLSTAIDGATDVVLVFVEERVRFEALLAGAAESIFPNGALWVAWPKRASKVPTDMTEDVVRAVALPMGLVDNKVCAIDGVWSGLRVVWRKELRKGARPSS